METKYKKVLDKLAAGFTLTAGQITTLTRSRAASHIIFEIRRRESSWCNIVTETITVKGPRDVAKYYMEIK